MKDYSTYNIIFELFIVLLSVPTGYLVSYMARDELIQGRKWFKAIIMIFVILGTWFFLTGKEHIAFTSLFIVIMAFISYVKSYDKKFISKK